MDEHNETGKENSSILSNVKKYFSKLSSIGKVKMLLLIAVLAVVVILSTNFVDSSTTQTIVSEKSSDKTSSYYVSSIDYCKEIEEKLENVLSNLNGLGNVEVMITLDSSLELVFAESIEEKTNSSLQTGSTGSYIVEVSSPIIIETSSGDEPLVVKEILPKIKGVLIVCSEMQNVASKLNIIQAVQSLLGINVSNIQVLSSLN